MNEYIYDGSFEGFLTAIFYAYQCPHESLITSTDNYVPSLITTPINIKTEEDKFKRVYDSIEKKLDSEILRTIFFLNLSGADDSDTLALKYLKLCYKHGTEAKFALQHPVVAKVARYSRQVTLEAHRFTGFVRFKKVGDMAFYASIEPDNNILPLILKHFEDRFRDQDFIIHDLRRSSALMYSKDTKSSMIVELSKEKGTLLSNMEDTEGDFENLWRQFYKSATIKERINPRLQKRSMPTRYWNHLTELE